MLNKLKWLAVYVILFATFITQCNIEYNTRISRDILIEMWQKMNVEYHIKQLPEDQIPQKEETEI